MALVQKSRFERYLDLPTKIMGFSTIEKCRFYGFKSLLLIKQHHQRRRQTSLLQQRRLKRYLELLTRIIG